MKLTDVRYRCELSTLLNDMGLVGHAAEVGVASGAFSKTLLDTWKGELLYLVDLWEPRTCVNDGCNCDAEGQAKMYEECMDAIGPHKNRVKVLKGWSHEMTARVPDDSLECIYIDATHLFPWVMLDLHVWYPKLRFGGIFAGHDYVDPVQPGLEVKPAVDLFADHLGASLHIISENDQPNPSWAFIKESHCDLRPFGMPRPEIRD